MSEFAGHNGKGFAYMMSLFNFIGSIFGYVLWWAYMLVQNFALAILIFTVVLRALQFPLQIKSQKTMAANARLQKKQQEIQEKYGKDKNKVNEEMQKLYEKENINPMSGCLSSFFPMILLLGVYQTIRYPITNTLHVASDAVAEAYKYIMGLPVIGNTINSAYYEIDMIKLFPNIKDQLTVFSDSDISKIESFAKGFNLFGLNLLDTPSEHGYLSAFILVPILCLVFSLGTSIISMKINGKGMGQQQGCMNAMLLFMPLMSAWIAYTVPAAVGLYWIYSNIIGMLTTVILHKFYNAESLTAKDEARRVALLEAEEANVRMAVRAYNGNRSAKKQKNKKK